MLQQAIDLNVNPSNETTLVAPLAVRFPIMGEGYSGSDAAQKFTGPGAQPPAVPTHSDDQYKQTIDGVDGVLTWTVDETQFDVSECIPCGAIPGFDNNAFTSWIRALCDDASRSRSAVFPASPPT